MDKLESRDFSLFGIGLYTIAEASRLTGISRTVCAADIPTASDTPMRLRHLCGSARFRRTMDAKPWLS